MAPMSLAVRSAGASLATVGGGAAAGGDEADGAAAGETAGALAIAEGSLGGGDEPEGPPSAHPPNERSAATNDPATTFRYEQACMGRDFNTTVADYCQIDHRSCYAAPNPGEQAHFSDRRSVAGQP